MMRQHFLEGVLGRHALKMYAYRAITKATVFPLCWTGDKGLVDHFIWSTNAGSLNSQHGR